MPFWISQYKVDDHPIGEGGMGRILRGVDPHGNEVAIKEILPEFAADIEMRFRISQEMRFLERLTHPSIVKTYESFMFMDKYYIIMELVKGLNLEQWVAQNGVFTEQQGVDTMISVLEVMQFVHENQIVHRDLKPSNIMIRDDGSVCLLDFGIAKDMSGNGTRRTISGSVIGSDGYMSPEQAMGMDIDSRSDIYALGCVLFFMLTGHHAFPKKATEAEMLIDITEKPFPRLSKYNKSVNSKLQKVIERASDKNMMRRFQTCAEFAQALRNVKSPDNNVSPGPGTNVSSSRMENRCLVTLGREGCDFIFDDPYQKVSRHHAEIELKIFTGGSYYIFRDDSSNGSVVNNSLVHHMAYHIPCEGPLPEIYLAGDYNQRVDWTSVIALLQERKAVIDREIVNQPQTDETGHAVNRDGVESVDDSEKQHTEKMFARPFSFHGRIRRMEYGLSLILANVYSWLSGLVFILVPTGQLDIVVASVIYYALSFPMIWFSIAQGCKRCHDRGNSGWYQLIPFYGLWMLFADGEWGSNRYGSNPKGLNA